MTQPAVCLLGEAAKTGFSIVNVNQKQAIDNRLEMGSHIRTEAVMTQYRMTTGSDDADAATLAILNAETDADYGAFTSNYGSFGFDLPYLLGRVTPLAELRRLASDLRLLHATLLTGDFSEENPPPSGLVTSPFYVAFNLWLFPEEERPGFSAMFATHSLYCFLGHEIICRALESRLFLVCERCHAFHRASRPDKRFCSGRCRTADCRERADEASAIAGGRSGVESPSTRPQRSARWLGAL